VLLKSNVIVVHYLIGRHSDVNIPTIMNALILCRISRKVNVVDSVMTSQCFPPSTAGRTTIVTTQHNVLPVSESYCV
jgi:hypothetical protein